jgi:hypothetical protein
MKKIIHKLAIETPVASILLIVVLCYLLYSLCTKNTIYLYLENQVIPVEDQGKHSIYVPVDEKYIERIDQYRQAIWYRNLESAVYDAEFVDVTYYDHQYFAVFDIKESDYAFEVADQQQKITVKVAFDEESIGKHLFAQKKGAIK